MDLQQRLTARSLHHIKNLQKIVDAHHTKAANLKLRKQWLDMQKRSNYSNEYERIRGLIANSLVRGKGIEGLKERKKNLEDLGAKAFDIA